MCSSIQFRGANTSKMVQKFGRQQYKYHLRDLLQQKTKGHFEKCWPTACLGRMLDGSEGRNGNCRTATSNKMQQAATHFMEQKPNKTCCRWLHQLPNLHWHHVPHTFPTPRTVSGTPAPASVPAGLRRRPSGHCEPPGKSQRFTLTCNLFTNFWRVPFQTFQKYMCLQRGKVRMLQVCP